MIQSRYGESIENLFELSIANEYRAAQLYEKFSKLFAHVWRIKKSWRSMQSEEINHSITLHNVRASLSLTQLSATSTNEMTGSVNKTKSLLENYLARSINNLDEAYKCSEHIEFSEINSIFKFLSAELTPYAKHEEAIHHIMVKHTKKISDFSQNFGDQEWRKSIKSKRD